MIFDKIFSVIMYSVHVCYLGRVFWGYMWGGFGYKMCISYSVHDNVIQDVYSAGTCGADSDTRCVYHTVYMIMLSRTCILGVHVGRIRVQDVSYSVHNNVIQDVYSGGTCGAVSNTRCISRTTVHDNVIQDVYSGGTCAIYSGTRCV